jgi:hypothetical protein
MRFCLSILVSFIFSVQCIDANDKAPTEEQIKTARQKGLKWLAGKQNDDGSWTGGPYVRNPAMTAYAMQAFMVNGHWPTEGEYKETVAKGMRFLLASAREKDGYLIGPRGGNMYTHALATETLADLFARTKDKSIQPVLERAVKLIVKSQHPQGGWRYEPAPTGADISVSTMQLIALKAARTSGITAPDETSKKGIEYIRSCTNSQKNGFTYQPRSYTTGFARTAAGLRALQVMGEFKAQDHAAMIQYLQNNFHSRSYFFYGHVYAVHVMKEVGGKEWEDWHTKIRTTLLANQAQDGTWSGTKLSSGGPTDPVYQTSLAVLILSVQAK